MKGVFANVQVDHDRSDRADAGDFLRNCARYGDDFLGGAAVVRPGHHNRGVCRCGSLRRSCRLLGADRSVDASATVPQPFLAAPEGTGTPL